VKNSNKPPPRMASFSRTAHVSIKDIARAAGVSHSTVSRALQGVPVVKRETAERIQQIALEAGYTASAVARSLVTRKTRTIGVVVTTITVRSGSCGPFTSDGWTESLSCLPG
jgi:DNA-binding LacI/PurR family transcriptional regulator